MFDNNDTGLGFGICTLAVLSLTASMLAGATLSGPGNLKTGRDTGIIFCVEKPAQCRTEYNYLKLKESQK